MQPRDIAAALKLSAQAVIQLLDQHHYDGGTMKSQPHSNTPATAGSPNDRAQAERDAAQALHAAAAARNVMAARQPAEILTASERATLAASKGTER